MPVERDTHPHLRTWQGIDRYEWNTAPNHRMWPDCPECGYRWEPQPEHWYSEVQCWNCHMVASGHAAKYWANYDANYRGVAKKQDCRLEAL